MAPPSSQVRQALTKLQAQIRQKPAGDATIVKTIQDTHREPTAEVRLTAEQVSSVEAAEAAIAADERFE